MSAPDSLTPEARAWIIREERRFQRAEEIARQVAGVDAKGAHRVLRNLEKTPAERLRAGLLHG